MKPLTKNDLIKHLRRLGIREGEVLLVHSSLSSLGAPVEGGCDAVIDALLESVGTTGTLLFPALSYATVTRDAPRFSLADTPCCVGKLPEAFRKRADVLRSMHPTHSVCALGPLARELTERHADDTTPVGSHSPFRLLYDKGGRILMLGCGLGPNTFMHGVEEVAGVPYVFSPLPVTYECVSENGTTRRVIHTRHGFNGIEQRYDRVLDVLDDRDYTVGHVANAACYLLDTRPLMEKATQKLQESPYYFVDRRQA